jgi:hypothetical protein
MWGEPAGCPRLPDSGGRCHRSAFRSPRGRQFPFRRQLNFRPVIAVEQRKPLQNPPVLEQDDQDISRIRNTTDGDLNCSHKFSSYFETAIPRKGVLLSVSTCTFRSTLRRDKRRQTDNRERRPAIVCTGIGSKIPARHATSIGPGSIHPFFRQHRVRDQLAIVFLVRTWRRVRQPKRVKGKPFVLR